MRSQYNPIIIISTDKTTRSRGTNSKNYIQFLESLELSGTPYRRCRGTYDGHEERFFILEHTPENLILAKKTAIFYKQESIPIMDNEGKGELFYIETGVFRKLGSLNVTTEQPQGDYTKVLDTQQYFTFS